MRHTNLALISLFVALFGAPILSQQPNTRTAFAIWGGEEGRSPISARVVVVDEGSVDLVVGAHSDQPLTIIHAPAGAKQGALDTIYGLVDLDLSLGAGTLLDGIGIGDGLAPDQDAMTGSNGLFELELPVDVPGITHLGGMQVLVGDPTSPAGYRLTAATNLTVVNRNVKPIYVSEGRGIPSWPGTRKHPLRSINAAIDLSLRVGEPFRPVHVAAGTYVESLELADGVSVVGGLDAESWAPTHERSVVCSGEDPTIVQDITQVTIISGLEFRADNATTPGGASIAVHVQNATPLLRFVECSFHAGNGADGSHGSHGEKPAAAAHDGSRGKDGGRGGAGGTRYAAGGAGGSGSGSDGATGQGPGGGSGGRGGSAPGSDGSPGAGGSRGADGLHGRSAQQGGCVRQHGWVSGSGNKGDDGAHGSGAGGGGSGHSVVIQGCVFTGGGGGGGGAGGKGGAAGAGGQNGGGSLAVVLVDASPTFLECTFTCAHGGSGGAGGNGVRGQGGGAGASGGSGEGPAGDGGAGGPGGRGGDGGGGAGGSGGPSVCLFLSGSSEPNLTRGIGLDVGVGGYPGAGGLHGNRRSRAMDGDDGWQAPIVRETGGAAAASSGPRPIALRGPAYR